jgi:hypothetical protein
MRLPGKAGNLRRRLFVLGYALVLTLGLCWPLVGPGFYDQHEGFTYAVRLNALVEGWASQGTHPRWSPELAGGHGYPLFNFYPPGFSYLALPFSPLGALAAVKLTVLLGTLLGLLCVYGLARSVSSFHGGIGAATLAAIAPYTMCNIHARGDFAEHLAFFAAAGVLWALLLALRRGLPAGRTLVFAAAYGAFVPLHTVSSLVYTALFAVIAVVWCAHRRFTFVRWARLAGGFALALMLSAWYWVPAILERRYVSTGRMLAGTYSIEEHFATLPGYFITLSRSQPVLGPAVTLALIAATVLALHRRRRVLPLTLAALAWICVLLNFEVALAFWDNMPLARYIQFPWRLNGPIVVLVAASLAASLRRLPRVVVRKGLVPAACVAALLTIAGLAVSLGKIVWLDPDNEDLRASTARWVTTSGVNEFLPAGAANNPGLANAPLIETSAEVISADISGTDIVAELHAAAPMDAVVRQWAYPGWRAFVDGQEVTWTADERGRLLVQLPQGRHSLQLRLHRTGVQWAAEWTSVAALALLAGLGVAVWRHRRQRRRPACGVLVDRRPIG